MTHFLLDMQRSHSLMPSRIMVYCHDLFGLGNVRRMLEYSRHLRDAYPAASILFALGSSKIEMFDLPSGMDTVKLPELSRRQDGTVGARVLDREHTRVLALRKSILRSCVLGFEPDLLLIDKKPLGAKDELSEALAVLPQECARVLVVRDILDAPQRTFADMAASGFHNKIRNHIDQVQVLGEPEIFNFSAAYHLPADIAARVKYTGYVVPRDKTIPRKEVAQTLGLHPDRKIVFVTVGGGEDGENVLTKTLRVADQEPSGPQYVLLAGPNLGAEAFSRLSTASVGLSHVCLIRSSTEVASLIHAADAVVSMAGYNSVCAILAAGKPAILMPRTEPSHEQLVRAQTLSKRGFVQALLPSTDLATLRVAIHRALRQQAQPDNTLRFDRDQTTARIAAGISEAMSQVSSLEEGPHPCSA